MVEPRGYRASELKRALRVAARSASASRTALRRWGGQSSETTSCGAASRRLADRDVDPGRRPAAHGLVDRLAHDLVERRLRMLPELLCMVDLELDLDVVPGRESPDERLDSGREAELAERLRLEVVAERAALLLASRADSSPRVRSSSVRSRSPLRSVASAASTICAIAERCWTGPAWSSSPSRRRSSCSARTRWARRARSGCSVNRSSPRAARWRPPGDACPPRASARCNARGSSRSPG